MPRPAELRAKRHREIDWTAWCPVLVVMALGLAIGAGFWGFSYDDAFITYRYADRLAAGDGLTYNPDERVLGTSAPGFAVVLAGLSWLGRPLGLGPPEWGTILSLLAIGAVCLLPLALVRRAGAERGARGEAASVSVLAAALALTLRWNVELLGAETLPVMALVVAAIVVARSGRHDLAAGLLVAVAATLRLDALLGGGALGAALWWHRRRLPGAFAAAALLPVAVWLGGLWLVYDSLLPSTLAAKQSELTATQLSITTPGYTLAEWRWLIRVLPLSAVLALAALVLAGVARLVGRRAWREPALLAAAGWIVALEVFYRLVAVPFAPWYHLATVGALALLAGLGAHAIGTWIAGLVSSKRATVIAAFAALAVVPVLAPSVAWLGSTWGRPPDPRFSIYREIGEHLRTQDDATSSSGRVAAVEIGILGYFSRRPILDLVGLVSPEARAARAQRRQRELLLEVLPEVVVDVPLFHAEYPVLADPQVIGLFVEEAAFEDPRSGRGRVVVRRRRPAM